MAILAARFAKKESLKTSEKLLCRDFIQKIHKLITF